MLIERIIKYRNVWMGLAIIWVVIFHAPISYSNPLFEFIRQCGYGGVDIFIFASGIGCYFSFSKDNNIKEFIKRRFFKLMPTYFLFIIIWLLVEQYKNGVSLDMIMGNILCIQELTGKGRVFNWYITLIWGLYLLTPYLVILVDSIKTIKMEVFTLLILFVFTIPFWNTFSTILVIRILLFYCGMCMAKRNKNVLSLGNIIVISICLIVGCYFLQYSHSVYSDELWLYGLYWYPFVLIIPGLCIMISLISNFAEKLLIGRWIIKMINCIGKYTFEIFLIHILVIHVYEWFLLPMNVLNNIQFTYILIFVAVPIGTVVLNIVTRIVLRLIIYIRKIVIS